MLSLSPMTKVMETYQNCRGTCVNAHFKPKELRTQAPGCVFGYIIVLTFY